ncbi:NAD(P)H-dependent glycerol-3-phosphate dehydrogenase [Campylobacter sp. MIT 21-1685]|uniref:NAD(P)H-dependent glycerol-3-phosphate dehydrogenase n=1 Tax=unclassified Campylobacter TaxID=2593542 RepID=UPI00224B191C|nr:MULTISPECIES: NAD(P)H-dependent glycerol-3-phosphate dehydrogenase [unclassified Campylobacter]MCX2682562.1 NAD(P)H-dependent glycerol-3-phosphate dehydrogenase [Campylobacter sp. MIT 21-1684]MCX2750725.1 NAD(P)H-dependent glycerol-3-phosphate dehydrogenase [Campylobacter sp. MIT 21-1682]MCX2807043.1 NAD(P)H-dependent glycerol-3-phosphate dehydrogenase [Campylobacter sp. MIT 21-1685]
MSNKLAIIGAGKWGQALQKAFLQKQICLITSPHTNNLPYFVEYKEALECQCLVFALSTQGLRLWLKKNFIYKNQKILLASKGIDMQTHQFLDEIVSEFVSRERICVLSGPSFAAEVMQSLPCALQISGQDKKLCEEFADFFPTFMKIYIDDDVRGAEICGAYKNVLAIASGINDGLKLGNNARASLISRGLMEMYRFGRFFGAKEETFLGLSGAGDLFLTASSTLSRNYRVGLALAKNQKIDDILADLAEVAEGVGTAFAIGKIAQDNGIYTPIVNEIVAILQGKDANSSVQNLLKRKA